MKRTIVVYGAIGAVAIVLLRAIEYRFLVVEHSLEIYGGLVAALFASLGIWLGLKLTRTSERVVVREVPVPGLQLPTAVERGSLASAPVAPTFVVDRASADRLGLTPREIETLQLIAQGLSNREIAGRLNVSENTVKTHSANLFAKLNARRRTQAVQIAKQAGVIP